MKHAALMGQHRTCTADVAIFSRTFTVDFVYYLLDLINDAVCLQIVRFVVATALFFCLNIFLVCLIVAGLKFSRHNVSHRLCCFPRLCVDVVVCAEVRCQKTLGYPHDLQEACYWM